MAEKLAESVNSAENYLIKARLPWKSASLSNGAAGELNGTNGNSTQEYLKFDVGQCLDPDLYAVLPNDWPYNVPKDVEHVVVWSKVRLVARTLRRLTRCSHSTIDSFPSSIPHSSRMTPRNGLEYNRMGLLDSRAIQRLSRRP